MLTAPRLSCFNTQRANVTIVNQIPYISDFQVQTAGQAKAFEAAPKDQALQHDEGLARAEADFASQKQKCQAAFDRRKRRINEAHKTLRRQAMDGVADPANPYLSGHLAEQMRRKIRVLQRTADAVTAEYGGSS